MKKELLRIERIDEVAEEEEEADGLIEAQEDDERAIREEEEEAERRKIARAERKKKEKLTKMKVSREIMDKYAANLCTNCNDKCDGFIPNKYSPEICEDCECAIKFHTIEQ